MECVHGRRKRELVVLHGTLLHAWRLLVDESCRPPPPRPPRGPKPAVPEAPATDSKVRPSRMQLAKLPQADGSSVTGMVVPSAVANIIRARLFLHLTPLDEDATGEGLEDVPEDVLCAVEALRQQGLVEDWRAKPASEVLAVDEDVQTVLQYLDVAS